MSVPLLSIAHRGASGLAPENTLSAFERALRMGAEAIELDIRQTSDGHLVAVHDFSLRRTTGDDRPVGAVRLSELKRLDAGTWWNRSFKGERIPTLPQILELLRKRCYLFIDLKQGSSLYPSIESRLMKTIREWNARAWITVASTDLDALRILRKGDPRLNLGIQPALTQAKRMVDLAGSVSAISIHLSTYRFRPQILPPLHRNGLKLYLYTVNRPGAMKALARMGVDGFFTNYPDRARAALGPRE